MRTGPMITASSMLPRGKLPGACRNRKTPPTATFIPIVFMTRASNPDTSRTSPVALRANTRGGGPPPWTASTAGIALLLLVSGSPERNDVDDVRGRADAVDHEAEAVLAIEHARGLERPVLLVEGDARHLERRRAAAHAEQRRLLAVAADDLDDARRAHALDPGALADRLVERAGTERVGREEVEFGE